MDADRQPPPSRLRGRQAEALATDDRIFQAAKAALAADPRASMADPRASMADQRTRLNRR